MSRINAGAISAAVLFAAAFSSIAQAEKAPAADYSGETLAAKKRFADTEVQALAAPYVGVVTHEGRQSGLYPITATGVSTEPIRVAAAAFLATLTPAQKLRSQFAVDDPAWRRWSNISNAAYARSGVSLKEMTKAQRTAATNLMKVSLSARGFAMTEAIRKTEVTLREINNNILAFDEELYFFKLMGIPSPTEPWGWQLQGHHLVINYFVQGDQVVMTPTFLGAEPAVARTGKYKGNAVLQDQQALGLEFMRALDEAKKAAATLDSRKTGNAIRGEANRDNFELEYQGVRAASFSDAERDRFLDLIESFVGVLRDEHAAVTLADIAAHLDDTWFAWIGPTDENAVFYYRIHSPVILIEFDHQNPGNTRIINPEAKPTRDHVHTMIRTPNGNDYGKDLLGQHLAEHPH